MEFDNKRRCDLCGSKATGPQVFSAWNAVGFPDAGEIHTQRVDLCATHHLDEDAKASRLNLSATL